VARKKRPASGLRNVLLLVLLVSVFALLAVGVRFFQDERVYITVSGPEELEALRTSDDNAYDDMMAAARAAATDRREYRSATSDLVLALNYRSRAPAESDTLFAEAWDDPSHGIWQFAEAGAETVGLIREALDKPVFFFRFPAEMFDMRHGATESLTPLLLSRGLWLLEEGAAEEGAACLLDGLRVAERLLPYDGYQPTHANIAQRILLEVYLWAVHRGDNARVATVQAAFAEARQFPDRCAMVEAQWRRLDDTLPGLVPVQHEGVGFGRRIGMRFFNRQVQRTAAIMVEHRETLLSLCAEPAPAFSDFVETITPGGRLNNGTAFVLRRMVEHVEATARWGARYEALLAGLALERHYRDTGAFAESLEGLIPAYLAEMPQDAIAQAPLLYRRDEGGYVLYSPGANGRDDGGDDRHDVILIRRPV